MEMSIHEALAAGFVGLLGFLLRSFFSRPHEDLTNLKSEIDKLEGRITLLTDAMHGEMTDTAVVKQELRAVWRHIDGAHARASDIGDSRGRNSGEDDFR